MKILMFGWEFPPFKSGGLGTACHDLTKGLSRQGVDVTFVMPVLPKDAQSEFVTLLGAKRFSQNVKVRGVSTILTPYMTSESYNERLKQVKVSATSGEQQVYGENLYEEVYKYSEAAKEIAAEEPHDIIHVHDWMTYQAGINARAVSGRPLVAHIHATEFDRTGGNPNLYIKDIECKGLLEADLIIANSEYTKNNVIRDYGINPEKIRIVHWGIDPQDSKYNAGFVSRISETDRIVLFLGRITIQKGPEYFVRAAKKVLEHENNVKFVMVGSGDMMPNVIHEAYHLGIMDKFLFTGFLRGQDAHRAFQMADLYVMPSVSEPFGLVALESMANGTPTIISKQSGVSEVVQNALKVDFWDVDEMANKIVGVLRHSELHHELSKNSFEEIQGFSLEEPARKCIDCYDELLRGAR
jgi:glycosyltransferase involved in cell wall biosynthesis